MSTLANFLVGIGLDFDNKGAKEAVSSLDSVKRTALQAGAAVAGAFGAKAITIDVANRTNHYRQMAEAIGTTTESLDALARVYEREGGDANNLISQLEAIKKLRAGLQTGNVDWIPQGALAGLDTSAIIGEADPVKAYQNILDQLSKMSVERRLNVAQAIGLDTKSINLAIKGGDYLNEQIAKALDRRPMIEQLSKDSETFTKQWSDLWDNIGGITDRAGAKIIPQVNEITGSINDFFDANREGINSGIDVVFGKIAENLDLIAVAAASLTAVGIGGTLSGMAKYLPIIGGTAGSIGAVAKNLGLIGVAAAGAGLIAGTIDEQGQKSETYADLDIKFTRWLYDTFGVDVSRGNVYEGTVITPSQTSPLSAPVQQAAAASQAATMPNYQPNIGGYNPQVKTMQPITIQLDGRQMQTFVVETMERQDEQTIKDLRSPVDR